MAFRPLDLEDSTPRVRLRPQMVNSRRRALQGASPAGMLRA